MANYWEKTSGRRTPVANAPQPPEDDVARAVREALARENNPYSPQPGNWGMPLPGPNNMLGDSPIPLESPYPMVAMNAPGFPRPQTSIADQVKPQYNGPGLGDSADIGGLLGGILGAFNGIGGMVADAANEAEANSPEALMEMLRKQYGSYQYNGPSAEEMAAREFDPQFAALGQMEQGTTKRYKTNSKDMAGLYKAYADDVLSGRGENAQVYKQATGDINSSYQGAQNTTTANMNNATKEMGNQLALLGQGEAAPAVFDTKQKVLAEQLGTLSEAQGSAAALNTQLGANTYASDTARHGIAQQAGLNAGQELMGQYEDLMNQYGAQRLGLQGARGQALNNYGMNIEKLTQEGNSGIQDAIAKSFGDLLSQQDKGLDRELQQGRLDLDLKKFLAGQGEDPVDTNKMNPYDALLQRSSQFNSDPTEAANDAEVVFQTAIGDPGAQNISVLMNLLEENNPGWLSQPGNKALAYDYFNRILSQGK